MMDYVEYLEEKVYETMKEIEQLSEIVKISEKDIKDGNIGKIEVDSLLSLYRKEIEAKYLVKIYNENVTASENFKDLEELLERGTESLERILEILVTAGWTKQR